MSYILIWEIWWNPFGHFKRNYYFHADGMSLDTACTRAAKFFPASLRTERMNSVPI